MPIGAVQPLLEQLSLGATLWGLSLHVLCATRRGQHGNCIEKLLDHCPQAIIPYANHHLQETYMVCGMQTHTQACKHTQESNAPYQTAQTFLVL